MCMKCVGLRIVGELGSSDVQPSIRMREPISHADRLVHIQILPYIWYWMSVITNVETQDILL
jgi:hypothetical protein